MISSLRQCFRLSLNLLEASKVYFRFLVNILQIVKRFGLVGGMGEYVFRLSEELSNSGSKVTILCERAYNSNPKGVDVIELGLSPKPRWFAHYKFSKEVNRWLAQNPNNKRIIHSHERQSMHHVTTFHTTPFRQVKPLVTRFLSFRNFFYERLERRELFSDSVKAVVPVSNLLGEMIKRKHPMSESLLRNAVHPGIFKETEGGFSQKKVTSDSGTLGFIGKEWKRKGLPKVVEIWRKLKKARPKLKLRIAGVSTEMIAHLFVPEDKDIEVLGLIKNKESFYNSIDLLVHPAKHEAFGMVITEALAMGVPVLCSSECGASEIVNHQQGGSLPENASISEWISKSENLLSYSHSQILYDRPWRQVAHEYNSIYSSITKEAN